MKLNPTPLEIAIFLAVSIALHLWTRYGKRIRRWWEELWKKRRGPRQLKPKSPEACPRCAKGYHALARHPRKDIVPWREVKGKAGRKKTADTKGYACMNPRCTYHWITDPAVHALVSDGKRGVRGDIPYLKCQACGKKHTSRLDTPMQDLKTPPERVAMVVSAMAEGLGLSAASRVFGHHPSTITNWVKRCGLHSARLHEQLLSRALETGHVQLDELVTKVRNQAEKVFLWTAVEARSKLIIGCQQRW